MANWLKKLNTRQIGYLEGFLSIIINTTLFAFKIWVGTKTKSISMIADAWHTLSDTLTSMVVIFGFWISSQPKDDEHPFGHGRAEIIAAIIIGTLLSVVGFNFIMDSIKNLKERVSPNFSSISLIIFGISALVKEALASFSIWAGKKIQSRSLVADGWHHRSDALASIVIVIAAIFGKFIWWIDGVFGIVVSLLILYTAFDIAKSASNSLLGEKADVKLIEDVNNIIHNVMPNLSDAHHIHIHRYGDHLEITMHLRMKDNLNVKSAHDIASKIENKIREELKAETTIHIEPEN